MFTVEVATVSALADHPHHSKIVIRTYGNAVALPSYGYVPVYQGVAPVVGQPGQGVTPVIPGLQTGSVASIAGIPYYHAGYTTAGYNTAGYNTAGYMTASYLPATAGYQVAGVTPLFTSSSFGGSTLDPSAIAAYNSYLSFHQSGTASTASASSSEFLVANSPRHQILANRVGGASILTGIGQFLRTFIGSPAFRSVADSLFRAFVPEGQAFLPLIDNFLNDLSGTPPASGNGGNVPFIPGLPIPTAGPGGVFTIKVIVQQEKDAAQSAPNGDPFFLGDKVKTDSAGGKVAVDRDGVEKTLTVVGDFKAGDEILAIRGNGVYVIKQSDGKRYRFDATTKRDNVSNPTLVTDSGR